MRITGILKGCKGHQTGFLVVRLDGQVIKHGERPTYGYWSASPSFSFLDCCSRKIFVCCDQPIIPAKLIYPFPLRFHEKARIVCMSDTHSLTPHIRFKVPDGDIFIHAGDFTRCGLEDEVVEFNNWISKLPHKHKIVIAGNHELSFDRTFTHPLSPNFVKNIPTLGNPQSDLVDAVSKVNIRDRLTNCIYLQDEMAELYGLKIYGTPWQPEFHGWAFNVRRGVDCLRKWDKIPDNVDILISHTPPVGHGDLCCSGVRAGCVELLSVVQKRVKPKYHVFGHIHEGYGITTDGSIIYINASTCNLNYKPVNPPVVFDVVLPEGHTIDR